MFKPLDFLPQMLRQTASVPKCVNWTPHYLVLETNPSRSSFSQTVSTEHKPLSVSWASSAGRFLPWCTFYPFIVGFFVTVRGSKQN